MFGTILTAVDNSPRALGVVTTALEIAERFDSKVFLFRVLTLPPEFPAAARSAPDDLAGILVQKARDELAALAGGHPRIVVEEPHVGAREPWRAILDRSKRLPADLIVIGSHGFGGWDHVLGSVAGKVVNNADRPVLVVHQAPPPRAP